MRDEPLTTHEFRAETGTQIPCCEGHCSCLWTLAISVLLRCSCPWLCWSLLSLTGIPVLPCFLGKQHSLYWPWLCQADAVWEVNVLFPSLTSWKSPTWGPPSLFFSNLCRSRGRLIHQMEGAWFPEWPGGAGPSRSKLHWPGIWTRNKVLLYQTTEIWGVINYHHCFWQKQRGQQHIWGGECPTDCQASSGGSAYRRELQMFPIESQGQSPTVGHALS